MTTDTPTDLPTDGSPDAPGDQFTDMRADAPTDAPTDEPTRRWPARPAGNLTVAVIGRGQSGKSTTVAALGDGLQRLTGWPTVLVDLDSTALLTKHLVASLPASGVVEDGLAQRAALHVQRLREGLGIVPAGWTLAQAEVDLEDDAVALRLVLPLGDAGWQVTVMDTQAMRPMVAGSAPLLRGAIDVADVVVVPFGTGSKNADHLELAMADLQDYQRASDRTLPVLLLPTMVDAADRKGVEMTSVMLRALGRGLAGRAGFGVLPWVKRAAVVQRSEYDHQLVASVPGEHEVVRQYDAVAAMVADVLVEVA